jgi:hypothetical protein
VSGLLLIVTFELPIVSSPPVVSLCEHSSGGTGGLKSVGHRLNSDVSPVTPAQVFVAGATDTDAVRAASISSVRIELLRLFLSCIVPRMNLPPLFIDFHIAVLPNLMFLPV